MRRPNGATARRESPGGRAARRNQAPGRGVGLYGAASSGNMVKPCVHEAVASHVAGVRVLLEQAYQTLSGADRSEAHE